jgi:hypothetical protein
MRMVLGFWIAPLTVGIVTGGALTLAIDPFAFLIGACAAAVAAVVTLALGVPVWLLLERLGWVDWRVYVAAGALAGGVLPGLLAVPAYLLIAANHLSGAFPGLAVALVGCAVLGGLAALIFWAAVRPDCDRSAQPVSRIPAGEGGAQRAALGG